MEIGLSLRLFLAILSCGVLGALGCGSDTATTSGSSASPTLASIQQNLFTPSCATVSCHDSSTEQSGLALTDAATSCSSLVGVAATENGATGRECTQGGATAASLKRVVAGDSAASFLYLKLAAPAECVVVGSTQAGERMPKDLGTISSALLATVKQWIDDGASCD